MKFELEHEEQKARSPYVWSITVFVLLAVFTGLEYAIGTADPNDIPIVSSNVVPLVIIALFKAYLIVTSYMHIARLWSTEKDEH
jgi:hypothetical protein